MHAKAARIPGRFAEIAVTALILAIGGCGGGKYSSPVQPSPQPQPPPSPSSSSNLQGWEVFFQSDLNPGQLIVLEATLSQTDKHLFSEANGAVIFLAQGSIPYQPVISVSHLGGECHSGGADEVTFDGTLANPNSGIQAATFTVAENSALGSVVITASASITATGAISGTYTLPAACGFAGDHGTISGYEDSTKFSAADIYRGTIEGNAVVVHLASVNDGVGASAGGTYDGTTLALTGFASNNALTLTGIISGQETTWFALYDSIYNTFRIYDSDANLIGGLAESP
jgi:hypothetical protein